MVFTIFVFLQLCHEEISLFGLFIQFRLLGHQILNRSLYAFESQIVLLLLLLQFLPFLFDLIVSLNYLLIIETVVSYFIFLKLFHFDR
jgi:hypothetical protein